MWTWPRDKVNNNWWRRKITPAWMTRSCTSFIWWTSNTASSTQRRINQKIWRNSKSSIKMLEIDISSSLSQWRRSYKQVRDQLFIKTESHRRRQLPTIIGFHYHDSRGWRLRRKTKRIYRSNRRRRRRKRQQIKEDGLIRTYQSILWITYFTITSKSSTCWRATTAEHTKLLCSRRSSATSGRVYASANFCHWRPISTQKRKTWPISSYTTEMSRI